MFKHRAFIALGSNLAGDCADPASQVLRAFVQIDALPHTKLLKKSCLYNSEPIGYENQANFINAVCEVNTDLSPLDLIDALFMIEKAAGRVRPFVNAPRELDCDLLMYDDVQLNTEKLTLPHPRMCDRAFVLLPLSEISPNLTFKNHGNVVTLANKLKNQGIKKLA